MIISIMRFILLLILILSSINAQENSFEWIKYTSDPKSKEFQTLNFPIWANKIVEEKKINVDYDISLTKNPFYLNGDFDGDYETDIAVWIQNRKTKELGILLIHRRKEVHILGAGKEYGNGGTDFKWMTNWNILPQKSVNNTEWEERFLFAKGDVIYVSKFEAGSALIFWKRNGYSWYQMSD